MSSTAVVKAGLNALRNTIGEKNFPKEVIYHTIKQTKPLTVPGSDGMPAFFYHTNWEASALICTEISFKKQWRSLNSTIEESKKNSGIWDLDAVVEIVMVNIVPAANFVEATTPKSLGSTREQFGVNRSEAFDFRNHKFSIILTELHKW